jgi:hypothetical protein
MNSSQQCLCSTPNTPGMNSNMNNDFWPDRTGLKINCVPMPDINYFPQNMNTNSGMDNNVPLANSLNQPVINFHINVAVPNNYVPPVSTSNVSIIL